MCVVMRVCFDGWRRTVFVVEGVETLRRVYCVCCVAAGVVGVSPKGEREFDVVSAGLRCCYSTRTWLCLVVALVVF